MSANNAVENHDMQVMVQQNHDEEEHPEETEDQAEESRKALMRARGLQLSADFKLHFPGNATLTIHFENDLTWTCVSFTEMYHLEIEMRE